MADENKTQPEAGPDKVNGVASITQVLTKSVIANGEEVTELIFREPTAGDIERIGSNPVNLDTSQDPPRMVFDARSMTQMMSVLAAVPPSTIRAMSPNDWNTIAWRLSHFFLPVF